MTTPAQPGRTTTAPAPTGVRASGGHDGPQQVDHPYVEDARASRATAGPTPAAQPVATGARTSGARPATASRAGAPRRVRLSVARVDPWSVMKLAFLLSVAVGIGLVVAVIALWTVLDGMGVFTDVDRVIADVAGEESGIRLTEVLGFGRVVSLATVIAVVDVVLLTALATLGAFLYNIGSTLVGGLHLTLSDD